MKCVISVITSGKHVITATSCNYVFSFNQFLDVNSENYLDQDDDLKTIIFKPSHSRACLVNNCVIQG